MKYLIVLALALVAFAVSEVEFKHNQGPPSEFDLYKLPKPQQAPTTSDSAIQHIYLTKVNEKEYEWKGDIFVDSLEYLSVTMASKLNNLKLVMTEPENKGKKADPEITFGSFGYNNAKVPTTTYAYTFDSDKRGVWKAYIHTTQDADIPEDGKAHISLIVENRSIFKAYSHTATFKTHVGKDVGLVTRLYASASHDTPNSPPIPITHKLLNSKIDMALIMPNGVRTVIRMHDNGVNMDGEKNDGVFGATLKAQDEGSYVAQVVMRGTTPEGVEFMRTTQHLIEVVEHDFDLLKQAQAKVVGDEVQFHLALDDKAKHVVGEKFKAYAEVWDNESTPIAWVSGMTVVKKTQDGKFYIPLHLNLKWLSTGKRLMNPAILKNIYIHHADKNIQITSIEKMDVVFPTKLDMDSIPKFNGIYTEDMLMGPRPAKYAQKKKGTGKVVLVHGYCAAGTPFTKEHFTNYSVFNDPNANRGHDAFALKIKDHIESFAEGASFVAHSQGGFATTHLVTFYWSNTDLLSEGRIIQTLGTPFQGTALAGSLANLGSQLGYGCGNNNDLPYDGAKNWLATVPMTQRKLVYSYITQYADWSWCSVVVNAILSWPNDGVTESKFTLLEGSNFLGTTKGQCHTTDMKYGPHGADEKRNKEMNTLAAR